LNSQDFDFTAIIRQFDTLLVGRRTFDTMVAERRVSMPGMKTIVFSQTLRQVDHPQVAIVAKDQQQTLAREDGRPTLDFLTTTTQHDLHHAMSRWNYGL
jgi:dihydrofolate reductase